MRPLGASVIHPLSGRTNYGGSFVRWLLDHPEDLARMAKGVKLTRELLATEPLASYVTGELWPGPT